MLSSLIIQTTTLAILLYTVHSMPIQAHIPHTPAPDPKHCPLRFDSTSSKSHENMSAVCAGKPDTSHSFLKSTLLAQNPNPFSIDFTCEAGIDAQMCLNAQAGFISAGDRISQLLRLPQTIRVKATFKSFCNGTTDGCALADTLGQASPAAYFSARPVSETESWYFYPQALVKQVLHDIQLVYNEYDILAEFNADFNFWFKQAQVPIQPDQTDFEFVVTHEFTHGLGIDTGLAQWGSLFPGMTTDASYLAPLPFITGDSVEQATVSNWQPLTIFDRFVADTSGKSITSRVRDVYEYENRDSSFEDFVSGFESSSSPFKAARKIYDLVSSGVEQLYLVASGESSSSLNEKIILQTSTTYKPGSSIAHMDLDTYRQSSDFLMIPAVQDLTGQSLDEIIQRYAEPGQPGVIYGEKTMALLTSMGYAQMGSDTLNTVVINPDAQGNPIMSGTERIGAGGLGLALVFLFL